MELIVSLILILASIDFILTLFWIYRWQSAPCIKKFKQKTPVRLIEANPIINHTIKKFGLYPGAFIGYGIVFSIQIAIASLHVIAAWIIIAILLLAIVSHMKNNITTKNKKIIRLTKAYNKKLKELGK